jgi:hypothetical protein
MKRFQVGLAALCLSATAIAAEPFDDKFRQLDELLPSANQYRTASGAPGHAYWQQRADYTLRVALDEAKRAITGSGQVTYHNNSPDTLHYLWLQLDQNIYQPDSDARSSRACATSWPAAISKAVSRLAPSGPPTVRR